MKTTYLVNQEQPDGGVCLAVVSSREWRTVVERNKQLPLDQQRYFVIDYITESSEIDRMVIETTAEDYRVWHKEHMASERNRRLGNAYQFVALDALRRGTDGFEYIQEDILSDEQLEEIVCNQMILEDLRLKLAEWRPWANDLLDMYLLGNQRSCSSVIAEKYGVSDRVVRKYKRQLEDFIKNFLEGVPF